jgi:SAM-dependent MidA family methyltransferase
MSQTLAQYPDINSAISKICLVEASKELAAIQRKELAGYSKPIAHYEYLNEVPEGIASIVIAHEFFDGMMISSPLMA